jgi:hypothetical protein
MTALKETTAKRLAKYFRLLASDHDGEVSAALQAAKRLLASEGLNFNDIGIVIENAVADGPLEIEPKKYTDTEANKIYEMGKQDGRAEEANNHPAIEPTEYYDGAGNPQWNAIALHCQKHIQLLPAKNHEFVDKMASQTIYREPTSAQCNYLLSLFRQLGSGRRQ